MKTFEREQNLLKRHQRVRKSIRGTPERPRLCVHRSHKNFYAQLIDDINRKTILGFSTRGKEFLKKGSKVTGVEASRLLGQVYAPLLKGKGVEKIVFDRGGYRYHGRVKALAEALRESGIAF